MSLCTCWGSSLMRYCANFCSWSRLKRDKYSDTGALRQTWLGQCILNRHRAITCAHHVAAFSQVQLHDVMRPRSNVTATLNVPLLLQGEWGWWTVALRWKPVKLIKTRGTSVSGFLCPHNNDNSSKNSQLLLTGHPFHAWEWSAWHFSL